MIEIIESSAPLFTIKGLSEAHIQGIRIALIELLHGQDPHDTDTQVEREVLFHVCVAQHDSEAQAREISGWQLV